MHFLFLDGLNGRKTNKLQDGFNPIALFNDKYGSNHDTGGIFNDILTGGYKIFMANLLLVPLKPYRSL